MKLFQKCKFHVDPLQDYELENVFLLNVMQVEQKKEKERKKERKNLLHHKIITTWKELMKEIRECNLIAQIIFQ